jgi:hypothetical protein
MRTMASPRGSCRNPRGFRDGDALFGVRALQDDGYALAVFLEAMNVMRVE